ncbi:asparagine synthase (glutamine-hydrolyzing) [Marinimicrococcus flavescens]|uniref:asparagine synthase (glutamine-hydrolyzing) n=1 Tax=Marinimicrococcus flavescens TaxID=3031815 RepID=A0AAP3V149_9PROT|nr:asparagine synthase (glutamine-hydrolyzing) [Marinimicrococcus flavescens]
MCGILGIVGRLADGPEPAFAAALDRIAHRGPDDAAVFSAPGIRLGHRRLSIIDLSSAGRQPMEDAQSGAQLVFNGEIYNYLELKAELEALGERFATRTDTEVLLRALLRWGEGALPRLNGMFAFALWLPREQRLFFARDRFGVKPFVWAMREGSMGFASEPKALLAAMDLPGAPDAAVLADFLVWGVARSPGRTFFDGLQQLPPGHCGSFRIGDAAPSLRRWWDYPDRPPEPADARAAAERFAELFDDAVRLRLRSDVPVGVSLSGGLDSTAVLAGWMKIGAAAPLCLTSVYGQSGGGESGWARRACAPYGLSPVEAMAAQDEWLDVLEQVAWHMDAPCDTPAVFPVWCLMREARARGVPVMLEGQGADEMFAGYTAYAGIDLAGRLGRLDLAGFARGLGAYRRTFPLRNLLSQVARTLVPGPATMARARLGGLSVLRPGLAAAVPGLAGLPGPAEAPPAALAGDPVSARLWQSHSFDSLPRYLHYSDAIGMAHAIESRMPFMDWRLVEWAFAQPTAIKLKDGRTKWPVRAYLEANGQKAIAERTDKKGYPTPLAAWLRGEAGSAVRDLLTAGDARIAAWCEPREIARLFERRRSPGGAGDLLLFRLLSTELWLRGRERRTAVPAAPAAAPVLATAG